MSKCIVSEIAKKGNKLLGQCVSCDKVLVCADLLNGVCEYLIGIHKRREEVSKTQKKGRKL